MVKNEFISTLNLKKKILNRLKPYLYLLKTLCKTVLKTFSVHCFYPGTGFKIIDFYPDLTPLCVSWDFNFDFNFDIYQLIKLLNSMDSGYS